MKYIHKIRSLILSLVIVKKKEHKKQLSKYCAPVSTNG